MAFVKFSSALLLVLCVSSIFSAVIESDVIVRVRDSDPSMVFSKKGGESSYEHVKSIEMPSSIAERNVKCPRVADGAYRPQGVGSCQVTQNHHGGGQGPCFSLDKLFTGASSIDTVSIKARECSGVDRLNCQEIKLVDDEDFHIDEDRVCISDFVCENSKLKDCIRYYRVVVENAKSNEKYTKAEGACASASTYLMVASSQKSLKGLDGRCLSTYQCNFEPLDLECTYARCTFNHQPFPMYVHASTIEPELTRGGIDFEELMNDECYKIRVPTNQGSAALDINNPTTCGVLDSSRYGVFVTATICGRQKFYGKLITPEPAEDGQYCISDSHCEEGTHCDKTSKPFVCKTTL